MSSYYRSILNVQDSSFSTNSFEFDGINDYIDLASRTQNFTDFSLSFWCVSGGGNYKCIVGSSNTSQGGILTVITQQSGFISYYDGTTAWTPLSSSIADGLWHHIVITYNSSTNTLLGYTDGTLSVTKTSVNPIATTNAHSFDRIGSYAGGQIYNEKIDEIAVWDSILDATQVSDIYGTGVPNDLSGLSPVHWWRMGEAATYAGSAWTLTDQGSGGNDGTSTTLPAPPAQPSTDVPT